MFGQDQIKENFGKRKTKPLRTLILLLLLSIILILLGFYFIDHFSSLLANQISVPITVTGLDWGIFCISIGFAILIFVASYTSDLYSRHETEEQIEAIYQYVKEKQNIAKITTSNPEKKDKNEEMERSCFIRILRKTTARRR